MECVLFENKIILIVEDELLIALDMAMTIEDAGGRVLGPAATVAEGLALIQSMVVAAAILDANLPDGDITPIAMLLVEQGIPLLICSAIGLPPTLAALYPNLPVMIKPLPAERVIASLATLIEIQKKGKLLPA